MHIQDHHSISDEVNSVQHVERVLQRDSNQTGAGPEHAQGASTHAGCGVRGHVVRGEEVKAEVAADHGGGARKDVRQHGLPNWQSVVEHVTHHTHQ